MPGQRQILTHPRRRHRIKAQLRPQIRSTNLKPAQLIQHRRNRLRHTPAVRPPPSCGSHPQSSSPAQSNPSKCPDPPATRTATGQPPPPAPTPPHLAANTGSRKCPGVSGSSSSSSTILAASGPTSAHSGHHAQARPHSPQRTAAAEHQASSRLRPPSPRHAPLSERQQTKILQYPLTPIIRRHHLKQPNQNHLQGAGDLTRRQATKNDSPRITRTCPPRRHQRHRGTDRSPGNVGAAAPDLRHQQTTQNPRAPQRQPAPEPQR